MNSLVDGWKSVMIMIAYFKKMYKQVSFFQQEMFLPDPAPIADPRIMAKKQIVPIITNAKVFLPDLKVYKFMPGIFAQ